MLDRITFTGADDKTDPQELIALSQKYPMIEWGILVSASSEGNPRYPTRAWIDKLLKVSPPELQLSMHVCGRWVRKLMLGECEMPTPSPKFQRIQLNFHDEKMKINPELFVKALENFGPCHIQRQQWMGPDLHFAPFGVVVEEPREFIFQIDHNGGKLLEATRAMNPPFSVVGLFDTSGGAGLLPEKWPSPRYKASDGSWEYHGYAGGLGPETIDDALPQIDAAANGCPYWIDMEGRVRSKNNGDVFDLKKVEYVMERVIPFGWGYDDKDSLDTQAQGLT